MYNIYLISSHTFLQRYQFAYQYSILAFHVMLYIVFCKPL